MSIKKNLIEKLLTNEKVADFSESLVFREEILDDSESIEILLDILKNSSKPLKLRARQMLLEFSPQSLTEISSALESQNVNWRSNLLEIILVIISVSDNNERNTIYDAIKANVIPLLSDQGKIQHEFNNPVEIEYQSRVCDEAYLLLMNLLEPEYFDADFLQLDEKIRNQEIAVFESRFNQNLLS